MRTRGKYTERSPPGVEVGSHTGQAFIPRLVHEGFPLLGTHPLGVAQGL